MIHLTLITTQRQRSRTMLHTNTGHNRRRTLLPQIRIQRQRTHNRLPSLRRLLHHRPLNTITRRHIHSLISRSHNRHINIPHSQSSTNMSHRLTTQRTRNINLQQLSSNSLPLRDLPQHTHQSAILTHSPLLSTQSNLSRTPNCILSLPQRFTNHRRTQFHGRLPRPLRTGYRVLLSTQISRLLTTNRNHLLTINGRLMTHMRHRRRRRPPLSPALTARTQHTKLQRIQAQPIRTTVPYSLPHDLNRINQNHQTVTTKHSPVPHRIPTYHRTQSRPPSTTSPKTVTVPQPQHQIIPTATHNQHTTQVAAVHPSQPASPNQTTATPKPSQQSLQ